MHWCKKFFVTLQRVYRASKLRLKVIRKASFSGKSPVFDQTEGCTPMLFAYGFALEANIIGIRHYAFSPSLFRFLAIPLLRRAEAMAYALFYFGCITS